jgi:hypothetical protein
MNRLLRIRINHEVLRAHLAREHGEEISESRIRRQLLAAGFVPQEGDLWVVHEKDLGFLEPTEVTEVEFVSRDDSNTSHDLN